MSDDETRAAVELEHSELEEQLRRCRDALAGGAEQPSSLELILELSEALEAHFGREESLYYPTVAALRPEIADSLSRIVETHAEFRARLEALVREVEASSSDRALRSLDEFTLLFRAHEHAEEGVLTSIAAGAAAST